MGMPSALATLQGKLAQLHTDNLSILSAIASISQPQYYILQNDNLTTLSYGAVVTLTYPAKFFTLMCYTTDGSTWTVNLQGSLDNLNWDTIATHTNITPGMGTLAIVSNATPVLYLRSQLVATNADTMRIYYLATV